MKIIQALIQIERPTNWNKQKILDIVNDLMNTEKYNASVSRTMDKFKTRWKYYENIQDNFTN
jgi:hypothetical protein